MTTCSSLEKRLGMSTIIYMDIAAYVTVAFFMSGQDEHPTK